MVFYGYGPHTPGWNENKRRELVRRLENLLDMKYGVPDPKIPSRINIETGLPIGKRPGGLPYVDPHGFGSDVLLRSLTNLSDAERDALVKEADAIFCDVMGVKPKGEA